MTLDPAPGITGFPIENGVTYVSWWEYSVNTLQKMLLESLCFYKFRNTIRMQLKYFMYYIEKKESELQSTQYIPVVLVNYSVGGRSLCRISTASESATPWYRVYKDNKRCNFPKHKLLFTMGLLEKARVFSQFLGIETNFLISFVQ